MLLISVTTQKKVNIFVNTRSTATNWPSMSATTYFSSKNINTIAPEYKRLLLIVWLKRLERIEVHPFFFTLHQMPKVVSNIIARIAIKTSGLTGAKTAKSAKASIWVLVVIRKPL